MEPVPYSVELKRLRCSKRETLTFIKEQVSKGCIPELNSRYRQQQAGTWFRIFQAGKASLKLIPLERPSSKILQDILHCSLIYESYPLSLHQGPALEGFQENHLGKFS